MNVVIQNHSGVEVLLQAFVRKDLDENSLEVLILSADELQRPARTELLFDYPAASELESDDDGERIS